MNVLLYLHIVVLDGPGFLLQSSKGWRFKKMWSSWCEVVLPGTEYSELLYRKLVVTQHSGAVGAHCGLLLLLLPSLLLCYQYTDFTVRERR